MTSRFNPAQPLNCREVDDKAMETAATRFVRHTTQVLFSQSLDIGGVYRTFLLPGSFFLHSRSPIQCRGSHECQFVVAKNVGLRTADIRVYVRRAIRAVAQEKLSDEPTAAKGSKEATSCWSQCFSHPVLCSSLFQSCLAAAGLGMYCV